MAERESGVGAAARAVTEDVKGKTKEVAGAVTGNEELESEGRAQQDRAEAERDVAEHEAKADKARAEAKTAEKKEQVHQD